MTVKALVRKGEYHDSVTLMRVAKLLSEQNGLRDSAVIMATNENKKILAEAGLLTDECKTATETDLIISVDAQEPSKADEMLTLATRELKAKPKTKDNAYNPKSLESALETLPEANLAIISIAGRYAADEAMKALERGLHVMLFSDNIPLERELELKTYASKHGLLVMGPDAGTAIINGVPLAFANNVNRGSIGIVAASGTGLQETSTLISNFGAGISQAIGTGGRDIKEEIDGLTFLAATHALLNDPETKVLLFISKPPHESVLKKILSAVKNSTKPIVATFLGANPDIFQGSNIIHTATLAEGALKAVELALNKSIGRTETDWQFAQAEAQKLKPEQECLRGLYTGGTFANEARLMCKGRLTDNACTLIDFGDDEYTVGRPHPMIDFSLRNKRIVEEAKNPETAVLLLDLVLGWGANQNPLPELLPTLIEARAIAETAGRHLPIIMSVTGTDADPQNRSKVVAALRNIGVRVEASNAAATELAIRIIEVKS
jgi:succinyl-CoA synthetase alpha subunit